MSRVSIGDDPREAAAPPGGRHGKMNRASGLKLRR
jgi:hypothetical protein